MSRVAVLKKAAGASSVKFLEVTRIRSKNPNLLACIFEGEDEKYYGCRLGTILGHNKWAGVNTGGRKVVLEVRELIIDHPIYNTTKFACFIDRDYETWINNPDPKRVYITNCYSVENLYANEICLSQILAAEFGATQYNERSADHNAAITAFNKSLKDFLDSALAFNTWAKSRAIMARDGKAPLKIYLSDVSAEDIAEIKIDKCSIKYDPSNISSLFKKLSQANLCQASVTEAHFALNKHGREYNFRGKQQLEFFGIFISLLKNDLIHNKGQVFTCKEKFKFKLSLEKTDLLSELSQYAETPECLTKFISSL